MGDHKGYALAFLIDILCGPLNGMPYGPHIPAMYGDMTARRNLGSLVVAIDPARFAGGIALARNGRPNGRRSSPTASQEFRLRSAGSWRH